MIDQIKPLAAELTSYCKNKLGFERPPELFFKQDEDNSKNPLGRTAHYDPSNFSVTVYVTARHPKDILRSLAHELVHHYQNTRGDLSAEKCGNMTATYAQDNEHMRNMEKEAYLLGNMMFRDWEDSYKQISLKENNMSKITREELKSLIEEALKSQLNEQEATAFPRSRIRREPEQQVGDPDLISPRSPEHAVRAITGIIQNAMSTSGGEKYDTGAGAGGQAVVRARLSPLDVKRINHLLAYTKSKGVNVQGIPDSVLQQLKPAAPAKPAAVRKPAAAPSQDAKGLAMPGVENPSGVMKASDYDIPADDEGVDPLDMPWLRENQKEEDCGCTDLNGTPEREENLYEARFGARNRRIFSKLLNEWTK